MLDLVWSHRVDHKTKTIGSGNANVYALYNRIFKNWSYAPADMMVFLQGLAGIHNQVEVQCSIAAAPGPQKEDALGTILRRHFGATRATSGFALMSPANFQLLVRFLQANQNHGLMGLLSDTFFRYRRNQTNSQWRI
jgi:hypothetical protein